MNVLNMITIRYLYSYLFVFECKIDNSSFFSSLVCYYRFPFNEKKTKRKKFHDFPETATESVSSYTKEENGQTNPMWTKEEVGEIVAAQVTSYLFDF